MRRKDREIADMAELTEVLRRCDTIRLGLFNQEYPYVVPVSFGLELTEGLPALYFHGAATGLRADCIRRNPRVCVEADLFARTEQLGTGVTARYESVIGFGEITELTDEAEKLHGLEVILAHYRYPAEMAQKCRSLACTAVYRVALRQLTGKRNLA